ncbi:hypothetical protein H6504_00880 [Candidatus Woesearchaeota archaeon]|nr:hypothetical protein [Candidatus Woesearchaeota archaeon]
MSSILDMDDVQRPQMYEGMIDDLRLELEARKDAANFASFRTKNLELTKHQISLSTSWDLYVIQSVRTVDDIIKVAHVLINRYREWYEYYCPEVSRKLPDNESFVRLTLEKDKVTLIRELGINSTMGAELYPADVDAMRSLGERILALYKEKQVQEEYVHSLMSHNCPNLLALAGTNIGARLIELAGSFEHLCRMPGSTIQLLGAEKALFRHIRSGSRCPKYGVLLYHPLVNKQPNPKKGKAASSVADKIALAVKVDKFKGEYVGDAFLKILEKRLG